MIEAVASPPDDGSPNDPDAEARNQRSRDDRKPADWPGGQDWGMLTIEAGCTPADLTCPTDLKLSNEAREWSERMMDDLSKQRSDRRKCRQRDARGVANHLPSRPS